MKAAGFDSTHVGTGGFGKCQHQPALFFNFKMVTPKLNIYTCNNFTGHWPVGTAAIVIASSREEAAEILNSKLKSDGLVPDRTPLDMDLIDNEIKQAIILCDGNY